MTAAPCRRAPLLAALLALAALLGAAAPARAAPHRREVEGIPAAVLLDGDRTEVRWTDGDSFHVDSGPLRGLGVRLVGYDALETYGPVHRIGTLPAATLEAIARASAPRLARATWSCRTTGRRDLYGRPLVDCPGAALALVGEGFAVVLARGRPADPALLSAQRDAQARRLGIWAGGVPPLVITSLHSPGEDGRPGPAHDQLADTRTGRVRPRTHDRAYRECEEVCVGAGAEASCMIFVPFHHRYRDRPGCLGAP